MRINTMLKVVDVVYHDRTAIFVFSQTRLENRKPERRWTNEENEPFFPRHGTKRRRRDEIDIRINGFQSNFPPNDRDNVYFTYALIMRGR